MAPSIDIMGKCSFGLRDNTIEFTFSVETYETSCGTLQKHLYILNFSTFCQFLTSNFITPFWNFI